MKKWIKDNLLQTPEDAFCNGFAISGLMFGIVFGFTLYLLSQALNYYSDNCVWWPKPLYPFGG